jgi:hypothetical protein
VKLKKGDIVMKNYFNGELSKFKRPFIVNAVNMEANEVNLKNKNDELKTVKVQAHNLLNENKLESFNENIDEKLTWKKKNSTLKRISSLEILVPTKNTSVW